MYRQNFVFMFLLLTILFSSYACKKKGATTPNPISYDLTINIDYGEIATPIAGDKIVSVSYITNVLTVDNSETAFNKQKVFEYNDSELLKGPIQIPELSQVKISIKTDGNSYLNDISKNADNNFDTTLTEYTFHMTNDKSFEVRISKAPIEMLDFIFEADANGSVEISISENGIPKPKQIATAGNSKKISVVKNNFANYSITAKAIESGGYVFDKWTGEASGDKNSLTITSDMVGIITANFVVDTPYSFTFQSRGESGTVEIVATNKTKPTDKKSLGYVSAGDQITISISKSTFNNYNVIAKATAVGGKAFDKWTDEASGNNNSLVVSSDIAGTITANFRAQNGSIEVLCTFTVPNKVEITVKHLGGVESYAQGTHYLVVKRSETIELIMNTTYPNRIDGVHFQHAPNSEITANGFGTYSKRTFDMSKGTSSSASFIINVL